jgi:hypothetical protein
MSSTPDQPAEYSYFRVEGRSLTAIETVVEAREELEGFRQKIFEKYGAGEILTAAGEGGRLRVSGLVFYSEDKLPAGWDLRRHERDGRFIAAKGLPTEGSPAAFFLANMVGLMERASRQSRLEDVLGCGEMPMTSRPAGHYIESFVRRMTLQEGGAAMSAGQIKDGVTGCTYSNSPISTSDPLDFAKLDGAWYIRVPNQPGTEQPHFLPPDAVPMPYQKMREADRAEWNQRHGIRPYNFPGIH